MKSGRAYNLTYNLTLAWAGSRTAETRKQSKAKHTKLAHANLASYTSCTNNALGGREIPIVSQLLMV